MRVCYQAMNKPRGIVTTASDEKGRATVYELLDTTGPWVAPVGRLDKASEGLLLLTNDSEWAAKITDPANHLAKTYHVQVDCVASPDLLAEIVHGCTVAGEHLMAKSARLPRAGAKNSWIEIVLDEGKSRQIRRLLNALEIEVLRLVRVSIGPLELGDLKKSAVRPLGKKRSRPSTKPSPARPSRKPDLMHYEVDLGFRRTENRKWELGKKQRAHAERCGVRMATARALLS